MNNLLLFAVNGLISSYVLNLNQSCRCHNTQTLQQERSCGKHSEALGKSIRTVPTKTDLCNYFCHACKGLKRAC